MKDYELDEYEKEILRDYEKGEFKSVPNLKQEIERLKSYAKATLDKIKK